MVSSLSLSTGYASTHCQKADVSAAFTIAPFPAWFATDLPHPIAWACAGYNSAQNNKERFESLDRLLHNLVKYLTAIALSQYWQDNPDRTQLRRPGWGSFPRSRLSLRLLF